MSSVNPSEPPESSGEPAAGDPPVPPFTYRPEDFPFGGYPGAGPEGAGPGASNPPGTNPSFPNPPRPNSPTNNANPSYPPSYAPNYQKPGYPGSTQPPTQPPPGGFPPVGQYPPMPPGYDQPGYGPAGFGPGYNQPGYNQPGYNQPVHGQPGFGPWSVGAYAGGARPATMGNRFLAKIIDSFIVAIPFAIVYVAADGNHNNSVKNWTTLAVAVATVAYDALFVAYRGTTIGKRARGIRVLDEQTGQFPTPGKALGRAVVQYLTNYLLLAGCWSPWLDRPRLRGWHDKAAGTAVVTNR